MAIIDDQFWRMARPIVVQILKQSYDRFKRKPNKDLDDIVKQLYSALLEGENTVFIHLPGVNAPAWPDDVKRQFIRDKHCHPKADKEHPERDYIYVRLNGTTFSGHSTKTTLGNTLRSLAYAWGYIMEAGVSDTPWNSTEVFVIASGDDVVIWCKPIHAEIIRATIRRMTTTDT